MSRFSEILLASFGVMAVAAAVWTFFGWATLLPSTGLEIIVIGLLGVVILAIVVDLHITRRTISDPLLKIREVLQQHPTARLLVGDREINANIERLGGSAHRSIRLLVHVLGPVPKLPDSLATTIARRLAQLTGQGLTARFDPILALNFDKMPPDFVKVIKERSTIYQAAGVGHLAQPRFLDLRAPLGLDVFLVDRQHTLIALTTTSGASDARFGVLFESQPQLASEFDDWLTAMVAPASKSIEELQAIASGAREPT